MSDLPHQSDLLLRALAAEAAQAEAEELILDLMEQVSRANEAASRLAQRLAAVEARRAA